MDSPNDIQFVTSPRDHIGMPCLQDMFNKIEAMIADGLKSHPCIDEAELRRRLAGKICWNDLTQLKAKFKLPKTLADKQPLTVWNEVVREVAKETDNFNFSRDMDVVKRKYEEVKGDPETSSMYDEKVKRQNLERESTDVKKQEGLAFRMQAYKEAKESLEALSQSMLANFKSHIIIYAACDVEREFDYPSFSYCNSAQSLAISKELQKSAGNEAPTLIWLKLAVSRRQDTAAKTFVFDGNQTYAQAKEKFRQITSKKWRDLGAKGKNIPWKELFFNENYGFEIVGWPVEGELMLPPPVNRQVNFQKYTAKQFLELAKSFYEGKTCFRIKENNTSSSVLQ